MADLETSPTPRMPPGYGMDGSRSFDWSLPTGALAQTFPRNQGSVNAAGPASGTLALTALQLWSGQVVSTITFSSKTTAGASLTNQWFALYSAARGLLGVTNDDTSVGWGSNATKTLTLATPYTVPTSGLYYVGLLIAAGTVPSFNGQAANASLQGVAPIISGTSTTGLTDPASAPSTAAALTAGAPYYAYVS